MLGTTLQDMIIRYKECKVMMPYMVAWYGSCGYCNTSKSRSTFKRRRCSRYDLGREKFLEKAWSWKEEYALLFVANGKN